MNTLETKVMNRLMATNKWTNNSNSVSFKVDNLPGMRNVLLVFTDGNSSYGMGVVYYSSTEVFGSIHDLKNNTIKSLNPTLDVGNKIITLNNLPSWSCVTICSKNTTIE